MDSGENDTQENKVALNRSGYAACTNILIEMKITAQNTVMNVRVNVIFKNIIELHGSFINDASAG